MQDNRIDNQEKPVTAIPTRLLNAALMVAPQAIEEILTAVKPQETAAANAAYGVVDPEIPYKLKTCAKSGSDVEFTEAGYAIIDGVAVIDITGGLTYRAYNWWTTSYSDIRNSFRAAMADDRAISVLLLVDSPGGEVAGLFDLVDEVYTSRGTKPIIAIADDMALSAAYAIASAADEVYLTQTAQVGSIGVIAIHTDQSGFDANIGIKYTSIYAGEQKNDFNPHEPLNADGKEVLQAQVDKIYDMFTAIVARNRSLTQAAVIATQAGFYMGSAAIAAGLADGIVSANDIIRKLSLCKGELGMNLNEVKDTINQALAESLSELKTILAEQCHILEGIEARLINEPAPLIDPPDTAEPCGGPTTAAPGDIVEMCDLAGMPELAGAMIRDELTLDEAKIAILDAKAKAAENATIISTVGPLSAGETNPVLADAKKRAAEYVVGSRMAEKNYEL
jgi:signal peptide peptidase SppA